MARRAPHEGEIFWPWPCARRRPGRRTGQSSYPRARVLPAGFAMRGAFARGNSSCRHFFVVSTGFPLGFHEVSTRAARVSTSGVRTSRDMRARAQLALGELATTTSTSGRENSARDDNLDKCGVSAGILAIAPDTRSHDETRVLMRARRSR